MLNFLQLYYANKFKKLVFLNHGFNRQISICLSLELKNFLRFIYQLFINHLFFFSDRKRKKKDNRLKIVLVMNSIERIQRNHILKNHPKIKRLTKMEKRLKKRK